MLVSGAHPLTVRAQQAKLEKNPREILLQQPQAESLKERGQADEARFFLREDNTLDHAIATGNVAIDSAPQPHAHSSNAFHVVARQLQVSMGAQNQPEAAILSGDVRVRTEGGQASEGSAGRIAFSFGQQNTLKKVHASEDVKLLQHGKSGASNAQDIEVTAPDMDFFLVNGSRLTKAETDGPPQSRLLPASGSAGPETRVTADKFTAKFDALGQLSQVHGEAHARVVSSPTANSPNAQPDRVSTSDSIDAYFRPGTGVETLLQQGHFAYRSGTQQAFGKSARYTPADELLTVSGSPRFVDSGMETTSGTMVFNRATGEARATGNVKTTYSDLKPQPNGALLASSDPIHVTAANMTARSNPQIATYTGNVRLWQDANLVQAPSIRFAKDERNMVADSTSQQKVSTTLIATDKDGKTTSIHITSDHLTYEDAKRQAHYEGSVVAQGSDLTLSCKQMDVFFARSGNAEQNTSLSQSQAKLEKIVASGSVLMTQPSRRGEGEKLVYTASDDKFVLTGGPPSIFDAEHGKITGVSLTLYRTDDRVIVDGSNSSPAVTETRVER
jgi:lipopolysaccharide export system protein LptA